LAFFTGEKVAKHGGGLLNKNCDNQC
jgi:hypothetical protein